MSQTLGEVWPLVLRHFDDVVRVLDTRPTAKPRKVSRRKVLEDCRETLNIQTIAVKHGVSQSVISAILHRAVQVAHACEIGKPPRLRRPRKTFTLTLTDLPARLIADIDA